MRHFSKYTMRMVCGVTCMGDCKKRENPKPSSPGNHQLISGEEGKGF